MNIEDMNDIEFAKFLTKIEEEIDERFGPLDWIDLTPYYEQKSVTWVWSNTNIKQDDEAFFDQIAQIVKFIKEMNDDYRASMVKYYSEEDEDLSAEAVVDARFDGGELYEGQ